LSLATEKRRGEGKKEQTMCDSCPGVVRLGPDGEWHQPQREEQQRSVERSIRDRIHEESHNLLWWSRIRLNYKVRMRLYCPLCPVPELFLTVSCLSLLMAT